jgi:FAD synthetase
MNVMVFGTFDDLHPGHEYVFTEALQRGKVWAVVARDSNVMKIKGRAPLQTQEQRMQAITQKFPDVQVMLGDPEDFLAPVRTVQPDLILLGYDQHLPPGVTAEELGVPTERLAPFHPEIHKSSLRREAKKLAS